MIRRPPRSTRTDTLLPEHDALPIFPASAGNRPRRVTAPRRWTTGSMGRPRVLAPRRCGQRGQAAGIGSADALGEGPRRGGAHAHHRRWPHLAVRRLPADRKSVVEGKRVSVREYLGGHRYIKKKKY